MVMRDDLMYTRAMSFQLRISVHPRQAHGNRCDSDSGPALQNLEEHAWRPCHRPMGLCCAFMDMTCCHSAFCRFRGLSLEACCHQCKYQREIGLWYEYHRTVMIAYIVVRDVSRGGWDSEKDERREWTCEIGTAVKVASACSRLRFRPPSSYSKCQLLEA
jgi:hypothetical protein